MAQAAIVVGGHEGTNDQRFERHIGTLTVGPGTYSPGGLPLASVLNAALLPKSNSNPFGVILYSQNGSGYIYQYIKSTGNMMILQVPLTGSLATAAPLVEILAGSTLSAVQADVIFFEAIYRRNATIFP
jgi:hypothetical protein